MYNNQKNNPADGENADGEWAIEQEAGPADKRVWKAGPQRPYCAARPSWRDAKAQNGCFMEILTQATFL